MSTAGHVAQESPGASLGAVFLLSAAVIVLELALMRCLAIARWHHFAYLVISTALLGFGASGTLLSFVGHRLCRRFSLAAVILGLAFAASVPACFRTAQSVPFDPRYVLYSGRHALLMFVHDLLLFVPFFLAATALGLAFVHGRDRTQMIYAANMTGSGAGAATALALMYVMSPERLLYVTAALGTAAALLWATSRRKGRWRLVAIAVLGCAAVVQDGVLRPVELRVDEYRPLGQMRIWERQGQAARVLTRHSPRATLHVYDSPLLHQTMFAGLKAEDVPPPQMALLADGDQVATVFKIDSAEEARILDHTPMALAYRFVPQPRVLLLGEAGGTNVWLARRCRQWPRPWRTWGVGASCGCSPGPRHVHVGVPMRVPGATVTHFNNSVTLPRRRHHQSLSPRRG